MVTFCLLFFFRSDQRLSFFSCKVMYVCFCILRFFCVRHLNLMQHSTHALSLGIFVLLNLDNLLSGMSYWTELHYLVQPMCEGKEIIRSNKLHSFHVWTPNTVEFFEFENCWLYASSHFSVHGMELRQAGSYDRHPCSESTKAQWNKGTKDQYETDVKGSRLLSLELYWCN